MERQLDLFADDELRPPWADFLHDYVQGRDEPPMDIAWQAAEAWLRETGVYPYDSPFELSVEMEGWLALTAVERIRLVKEEPLEG